MLTLLNLLAILLGLLILKGIIVATTQQVLDAIAGIGAQLSKATTELVGKIEALEAEAGQDEFADLDSILAKLADLKTSAQALDDIVPDPTPDSTAPAA